MHVQDASLGGRFTMFHIIPHHAIGLDFVFLELYLYTCLGDLHERLTPALQLEVGI